MKTEEKLKIVCGQLITHILTKYKKKYDFIAKEHLESHNIQQAIIYEEKSKTISEIAKELKIGE